MSSYSGIIDIGDVKNMKDNRLFRILYYILDKGKVTANELAERFEVSARTIYRDIDAIAVREFLFMQHKEKVEE